MKFKLFLCVVLLVWAAASDAQSFFAPISKPVQAVRNPFIHATTVAPDSTLNAFRPVVSVAAYSYPGNHAMTGVGAAYEHLKYDRTAQKWDVIYSFGAYAWYNTPLPSGESTNQTPVSFGFAATVLNGLLLAGIASDGTHIGPVIGVNINLN